MRWSNDRRRAGDVRRRSSAARSEEHTSELQSQSNLVCRLLLEKKNHGLNHLRPPGPSKNAGSDGTYLRADIASLEPAYSAARDPPAPTPDPASATMTITAPTITSGAAYRRSQELRGDGG